MIDVPRLRGIIAEKGYKQTDVARVLGISAQAFYEKMDRGVFKTNEVEKMVPFLGISDPLSIFFTELVN